MDGDALLRSGRENTSEMPADKMMKSRRKKDRVRIQAAEDLVIKGVTERNPAARTVKDTYDTLNDLEKLRTGEDKSLLNKI